VSCSEIVGDGADGRVGLCQNLVEALDE